MSNNTWVEQQLLQQIGVHTHTVALQQFLGAWKSMFSGQGLTFAQSRQYQPGDPQHRIDRKITAKKQDLYSKEFEEDKMMHLLFALDGAASMHFTSSPYFQTKYAYALQAISMLWYATVMLGDSAGGIGFSASSYAYSRPKQGLSGLLTRKHMLTNYQQGGEITHSSLDRLCTDLLRYRLKHTLVVVFCDDLLQEDLPLLRVLAQYNDLIVCHCFDPTESDLDNHDRMVQWGHMSSGSTTQFHLLNSTKKAQYKKTFTDNRAQTESIIRRAGGDYWLLDTSADMLTQLVEALYRRKHMHYAQRR